MGVVSLDQITAPAFEQRYGVPAINIFNDLTLEGVLAGAVEARSPMIVQTAARPSGRKICKFPIMCAITKPTSARPDKAMTSF